MVMMGNRATYYYFSDNAEFEFSAELIESGKLAPLCPTANGTALFQRLR